MTAEERQAKIDFLKRWNVRDAEKMSDTQLTETYNWHVEYADEQEFLR